MDKNTLENAINSENMLYEGKGKRLYKIDSNLYDMLADRAAIKENLSSEDILLSVFKDDLTAFNALKKSSQEGKGELNCKISSIIFKTLELDSIKTHYIPLKLEAANEFKNIMLCKKVEIIPLEVVTRNIATGSLVKRLGIEEKLDIKSTPLNSPLVEFYYKNDDLQDPILTDSHCLLMNLTSQNELETLKNLALKINEILRIFFDKSNLILVDFKLEFGRDKHGNILLADEISPDSCRLWDKTTGKKMDKDIFRQDLGNLQAAYQEVFNRIKG